MWIKIKGDKTMLTFILVSILAVLVYIANILTDSREHLRRIFVYTNTAASKDDLSIIIDLHARNIIDEIQYASPKMHPEDIFNSQHKMYNNITSSQKSLEKIEGILGEISAQLTIK